MAQTKKMIVLRVDGSCFMRTAGRWLSGGRSGGVFGRGRGRGLGVGGGGRQGGGRGTAGAPVTRSSGAVFGGEPYQRAFHVVKQTRPGPLRGALARDEHIVATRPSVGGQQQARGLP